MKIVAVTGGSGLVGSEIVRRLLSSGVAVRCLLRSDKNLGLLAALSHDTASNNAHQLEIVACDVLDMTGLMKSLEGVDAVIHAAGIVSFNPRLRDKIYEINTEGTRHIVNSCLMLGIRKLVHISSVAALGRPKGATRIDETSRWIAGNPASHYATSKYMGEVEVFRGFEEGLQVSIINPSVVLSAGDGTRSSSQMFNYVARERWFYTDVLLNYVDARDVAEMAVKLTDNGHNGERFIASAGAENLKVVFKKIGERLHKRPPFIEVPKGLVNLAATFESWRAIWAGAEPMVTKESVAFMKEKTVFDGAKAQNVLGMKFQTLEKTLDWCCETLRSVNINK